MRGTYRDQILDDGGRLVASSGWRSNTIVASAGVLAAGSLIGHPNASGSLHWAVGEGLATWDARPPQASPKTERLRNELARVALDPRSARFLDAQGRPSAQPTDRLELPVEFRFTSRATLREFGVFGGGEARQAGRGLLLNYVIHPPLQVPARGVLRRTLRLDFGRDPNAPPPRPPRVDPPPEPPRTDPPPDPFSAPLPEDHWLLEVPATALQGFRPIQPTALEGARIRTLADLATSTASAAFEPSRTFARLLLRQIAALPVDERLDRMTLQQVQRADPAELARATGLDEAQATALIERALTFLLLDQATLRRVTMRRLRGG